MNPKILVVEKGLLLKKDDLMVITAAAGFIGGNLTLRFKSPWHHLAGRGIALT